MVVRSPDQVGVLRITVQSASGLKAGSQGTSDPYTELYLGEHHFHKTSTLSKTCDPVWDETFECQSRAKQGIHTTALDAACAARPPLQKPARLLRAAL